MGEGGEAGASEGRVISKFLQIGEGQPCFIPLPGEGHSFFWQGKNYSISLSWLLFVNKHVKCVET